jgi:hypothetical protein
MRRCCFANWMTRASGCIKFLMVNDTAFGLCARSLRWALTIRGAKGRGARHRH